MKWTLAIVGAVVVACALQYFFFLKKDPPISTAMQETCASKLDAFIAREISEQDYYTQTAIDSGYPADMAARIDRSSFVVSYSPQLNSCVGGFRVTENYPETSSTGDEVPTRHESYYVRNIDSNEILGSYSELLEKISNPDIRSKENQPYSSDVVVTFAANDAARADWYKKLSELTGGKISATKGDGPLTN